MTAVEEVVLRWGETYDPGPVVHDGEIGATVAMCGAPFDAERAKAACRPGGPPHRHCAACCVEIRRRYPTSCKFGATFRCGARP